eukprot:s299_g5.t3
MDGKLITDVFRRFDKNRDGIISSEELLSVLSRITLQKADMSKLLKHIDTNGDGKIQYEEFVNWILKAGSGDGLDQERSSVLEAHAQAAHHKVQRVRDSQTGARRAEVFVNQLTSEKGLASLAELAEKPPKGALAVCAAAYNLLYKKVDWATAKSMLVDLDQFQARLLAFEPADIPDYVVQSYQQTLDLPYFDFNRMVDTNYGCACLASWVLASTCSDPWQHSQEAAHRADTALEVLKPPSSQKEAEAKPTCEKVDGAILRVLRPTLTQISDIDHQQKELLQVVENHGRNIDKVDQLQFEVIKQSQLTKVMEDTTASMANQVRELETVYGQQYLDVKSTLDLQQSSVTAVKNDIDRLNREDTRIWDEALRLQHQHDEALRTNRDSMSACHKRIDREREELDDRLDAMNSQREQLLEDLYGDDKGLTLLTKELKELTDFAAPIPSMLRRITDTERGLKDLTKRQENLEKDLEQNRVEWHQYVEHQDEEMAEMKATFRKQCNSLVAHNAEIMRDIRRDYHFEIKGVEEMRKEIAESLKQVVQISDETEEKVDKERFRIDRIQKEVKQEGRLRTFRIREMGKTQLADRAKNDQRAEKIRMDLEEERELNVPTRAQFDSVSKLTGLLLEGCRVGCALTIQDFADRSQEIVGDWIKFVGGGRFQGSQTFDHGLELRLGQVGYVHSIPGSRGDFGCTFGPLKVSLDHGDIQPSAVPSIVKQESERCEQLRAAELPRSSKATFRDAGHPLRSVPSADSALAVTELDLSAVDVEFGYPIQSWTFAGVSGAEVDILATAAAE